jgi:DNA-binding transcriptional LysR family regulator
MDAGLSWDEFRLVKAIADARSLSGAAERLGLNHSTIFRRLSALEKAVGARLFERSRSGYETTAAGREMAALAAVMADSIIDFERRVAGRDAKPVGLLRVSAGEMIGRRFLPAIMTLYRGRYPSVTLELSLTNQLANLARREADIALRMTNDPSDTLVGRRLCSVHWAPYCRRDLFEAEGFLGLEGLPFVGFGEGFGGAATRRWVDTKIRPMRIAARVNSVESMLELALHGFGAALLPCFIGEGEPSLLRVGQRVPDLEVGLWILTHADLRRSARVRSFMDLVGAEFAKYRRTLEGAAQETAAAVG